VTEAQISEIWTTQQWGYVADAFLPTIVLDTRTRRQLNPRELSPGLMDNDALDWLKGRLGEMPVRADRPIMIVSPAPVLGYEAIESIQRSMRNPSEAAEWDTEAWSLRRASFFAFLDILLKSHHPNFLILAGDVHYGFSSQARYSRDGRFIKLVQFVSSATKNCANDPAQAVIQTLSSVRPHVLSSGTAELAWCAKPPVNVNNVGLVRVNACFVEQSLLIEPGQLEGGIQDPRPENFDFFYWTLP
jgi:phosphodiesterase/alkaline phosphatase D-like protein